jgi:FAD/FMN-containing dehydrogenase
MNAELPASFLSAVASVVGEPHVLTGDLTAGFTVDWTGRFSGHSPAVVRPRDTYEVAKVLALCAKAGVAVVAQGGNTGLVGGGVPLAGEVVLSLSRLTELGPVDTEASQVTAGAGVTLEQVANAHPDLDFGVLVASRQSATVGGAIATNAGGLRVLRYGPMRAQLRGIEAVLSDGSVISHMSGIVKDNTGYDYPSLLAGSEGTLAVITKARLRLVARAPNPVVALIGLDGLASAHHLARRAVREVPGLMSAEFFTRAGLQILLEHTGLPEPLKPAAETYLLLEASSSGALDDLAALIGGLPSAVAVSPADREQLWAYRERHPEVAGFLGNPLKLDVSVPAGQWVRLASDIGEIVTDADPDARVITYGHIADGNLHVNVVPSRNADGRHEDAVFSFVASLGGSISAEHGIGALKARWLTLARSPSEYALFTRIRSAFDPYGILNPNVLPAALSAGLGRLLQPRQCLGGVADELAAPNAADKSSPPTWREMAACRGGAPGRGPGPLRGPGRIVVDCHRGLLLQVAHDQQFEAHRVGLASGVPLCRQVDLVARHGEQETGPARLFLSFPGLVIGGPSPGDNGSIAAPSRGRLEGAEDYELARAPHRPEPRLPVGACHCPGWSDYAVLVSGTERAGGNAGEEVLRCAYPGCEQEPQPKQAGAARQEYRRQPDPVTGEPDLPLTRFRWR